MRTLRILLFPVLMLMTLLSGCVSSPDRQTAGMSKSSRSSGGYAIREEVRLSAELREDFEKAVSLLQAEKYDEGIALLLAITTHPQASRNTAPHINLAIAYRETDRLEEAEKSLKEALAINPEHPAANNEYGLVLRKTGRFHEARAAYERVLRNYPEYLPARRNLGILCDLFLGDAQCALEHYRIYSAAVPEDKSVALWIADLENRLAR
jgi:tetratricopeptide (TPR) repeat protein